MGGWRFGGGNAATVKDVYGYYICVYAVLSGTYTVSFRAKQEQQESMAVPGSVTCKNIITLLRILCMIVREQRAVSNLWMSGFTDTDASYGHRICSAARRIPLNFES